MVGKAETENFELGLELLGVGAQASGRDVRTSIRRFIQIGQDERAEVSPFSKGCKNMNMIKQEKVLIGIRYLKLGRLVCVLTIIMCHQQALNSGQAEGS